MRSALVRHFRRAGFALGAVLLQSLAPAGLAIADDAADFHAAIEQAAAQNRVALSVLETSGPEQTTAEVQRLREDWRVIVEQFGSKRPAVFVDDESYATTLLDTDLRIVGVLIIIKIGARDAARAALVSIGDTLARLQARAATPPLR